MGQHVPVGHITATFFFFFRPNPTLQEEGLVHAATSAPLFSFCDTEMRKPGRRQQQTQRRYGSLRAVAGRGIAKHFFGESAADAHRLKVGYAGPDMVSTDQRAKTVPYARAGDNTSWLCTPVFVLCATELHGPLLARHTWQEHGPSPLYLIAAVRCWAPQYPPP